MEMQKCKSKLRKGAWGRKSKAQIPVFFAEAAASLLGEHAKFITVTDLLARGGVIVSIRTGEFKLR